MALRVFEIRYLILATLSLLASIEAEAGFIVNISEVGADVVAIGSGSLNVSGFNTVLPSLRPTGPSVGPNNGVIQIGNATPAILDTYLAIGISMTGPNNFGTSSGKAASSGSGDRVAITANVALSLDPGYVSGTALNSNATWNNESLNSLGITPGTYTWSWGSGGTADFFTINVAAVPEPSTVILSCIAVACVGARRASRRARPILH